MTKRTRGKKLVLFIGIVVAVLLVGSAWLCWNHIRFWYSFESLGKNEQGYPEYRHRQTGIVMVRVPGGGPFHFFTSDHPVTLEPFLIGKYEVSQDQWKKVMKYNGSKHRGSDLPEDSLCWAECREFCENTGLSMPMSEQWIFVCWEGRRAHAPGADLLAIPTHANMKSKRTLPVTSLLPTAFGLHHMRGNVFEWCDRTDKSYPCLGGSYMTDSGTRFTGVAPGPGASRYERDDFGFRPAFYPLP